MLELEARAFLGAITRLRTLSVHTGRIERRDQLLGSEDKALVAQHLDWLIPEISKTSARSALICAERLRASFNPGTTDITYAHLAMQINDIESRFADHLDDIKFFVLNPSEVMLMQPVDALLSVPERAAVGFSLAFPNASFEIEEAAKCCALNRYTASVFHSMRALESGIRAMCAFLGIPDATKPAEKNWAIILRTLSEKIDERWPKNTRLPNTMGSKMESLYATLDAVKNPWRNATMHVETTYAPHEALHILRCVSMFLLDLASYCDEQGRGPTESPAMTSIDESPSSEASTHGG